MKLTRRQKEIVKKLITLYHNLEGQALHYTELAEYLGVNRFTAYDMLKLLEEKGLVVSHYRITENSGPGRSEVVFEPTALAHNLAQGVAQVVAAEEWEKMRESLWNYSKIHEDNDILARFIDPHQEPSVSYCAEVITVIFLRLKNQHGREHLLNLWPLLGLDAEHTTPAQLTLLSGITLGILATNGVNDQLWWSELIYHTTRYQQIVMQLTPLQCRELAQILGEIVTLLQLNESQTAKTSSYIDEQDQ